MGRSATSSGTQIKGLENCARKAPADNLSRGTAGK
jgi:hypothetical protein